MNAVVDWDGTVTERDTLSDVLTHFVDASVFGALTEKLDAQLAAGTISLRDVMAAEFRLLTASVEDVTAYVLREARVRPGFEAFARRYDPLIVSTSFRQTIEPVLLREHLRLRVVASEAHPSDKGWSMTWLSARRCAFCGEPCKRSALPNDVSAYVGDGYSDRCAAQAARRIFARDGLARYFDDAGVAYERFEDFNDVIAALERD